MSVILVIYRSMREVAHMGSIMHFSLRSFCASLEQIKRPELAGRPVVVTHNAGRGEVVISASREAMIQGVQEAMTARHAGRYAPLATFVHADWDLYQEMSERAWDVLSHYSPLLEPYAIDRAYMDVAGCAFFGTPADIAAEARQKIAYEVGVTPSVGVGRSKLVADAASRACGLGGYREVCPDSELEFLAPMAVSVLPGVSSRIEKRLMLLGVKTIGELSTVPERLLIRQFGELGAKLYRLSQGVDFSPVLALYPPLSISAEHMFDKGGENLREPEYVEAYLYRLCEKLASKLRRRDAHAKVVMLRAELSTGRTVNRRYRPKTPVKAVDEIFAAARRLLRAEMRGEEVASIGLTLTEIGSGGGIQLSMTGESERRMKLDFVLDTIRSRFGDDSIGVYGAARTLVR